jgi:polysaccharide pyruvyl transferase WcaK-like protein
MKLIQKDIRIIGYYDHSNTGDEQYKVSFKRMFNEYLPLHIKCNIDFIDCDKIEEYTFQKDDIIVIGGGDILSKYFIDKLHNKFVNEENIVIAVSVGIPFLSYVVESHKLDFIDYIFLRTKQDLKFLSNHFPNEKIYYLPDISVLLCNGEINKKNDGDGLTISICLSRHVFHIEYQEEYYNFLKSFGEMLIDLCTEHNAKLVFIPFNTNKHNESENDILIQQDIINYIRSKSSVSQDRLINISHKLTEVECIKLMEESDMCIPMRFHAVLFSIYASTPMFPIYTTRKIDNLLLDIEYNSNYSHRLKTNSIGIPNDMSFDVKNITNKINGIVKNLKNVSVSLTQIKNNLVRDSIPCVSKLIKILLEYEKNSSTKSDKKNKVIDETNAKFDQIKCTINRFAYDKTNGKVTHFTKVTDSYLQNIIVQIVSYYLTGIPNSEYNYGLLNKMFEENYDIHKEWLWVCENEKNKVPRKLESNQYGLFNIQYIDQIDYSGAHRSGWQYVYDGIKHLHNDKSPLLLDMYIDRTFHWNHDLNKVIGLVPYKTPWIGFIHHTFDETFSIYNCVALLKNTSFLQSLQFCKGLIVLSNDLKEKLNNELNRLGFNINVHKLFHPTEIPMQQNFFKLEKFRQNQSKSILHVGGWLRNTYAFYNYVIPSPIRFRYSFFKNEKITLQKKLIKGKYNNNYYPEESFLANLNNILVQNSSIHNIIGISGKFISTPMSSSEEIKNNWYREFFEDVKLKVNSVECINEHLDDKAYDELLSQNLVCITLIDASAINTLIECIVRNTPIIINKIPPVVEILGPKYPLYLTSNPRDTNNLMKDLDKLLSKSSNIRNAYLYIKKLDKTPFTIESFVKSFVSLCNQLHNKTT